MLELLQSAVDFSWSMSLLGLQELSSLFHNPDSLATTLAGLTSAAESELEGYAKSVYQAGQGLERNIFKSMFPSSLLRPCGSLAALPVAQRGFPEASVGPVEQTLIRVSQGTGTVRHTIDGQAYFIVHGQMRDPHGHADGEFDGVWGAKVFTPSDLVAYPDSPPPPFDRPPRPGENLWNPALNPTKSKWMFSNGGWLESTGPALSRIQIQSDRRTQFWYSVAGFVTGGGGVYQGYRGQAVSLGSAYFVTPPQPLEGLSFELNAVHSLKIVPVTWSGAAAGPARV